MVRTLITFDDQQLKRIDRLAKKDKKSRAALVRQAVAEYIDKKEKKPTWKEIVAKTAGIWKHKNIDTDTYLTQLRAEWER